MMDGFPGESELSRIRIILTRPWPPQKGAFFTRVVGTFCAARRILGQEQHADTAHFICTLARRRRVMSRYDSHTVRRLSAMTGYYQAGDAFIDRLAVDDPIHYEVFGIDRPAVAGELISGLTRLYAGKVSRIVYDQRPLSCRARNG